MKNRVAIVLATTLVGLGSASAADLPRKAPAPAIAPVYDWTGFYVGGAAGFRSANVDSNLTSITTPGVANVLPAVCAAQGGCAGQELDSVGFKGGVYTGFNWQFAPRLVAGVEADWMWADHEASIRGTTFPTNVVAIGLGMSGVAGDSFAVRTEWDASLRARLGFLVTPSIMVFATGGASWISLESTSACASPFPFCTGPGGPAVVTNSDTVLGWTAGAGIEAMLSPNWLVRGEYRYADYGTNTYSVTRSSPGVSFTSTYDVALKTHTALFGIAYKFGGPVSPLSARAEAFAMPAPGASSWSGLYVGAAAGLRAADADGNVTASLQNGVNLLPPACPTVGGCLGQEFDSSGFKGGLYGGFNWQFAPTWVAGLEADWMWADHDATLNGAVLPSSAGIPAAGLTGRAGDSFSVGTEWDASLRARFGYLITPSVLVFATGGASWLSLETVSTCGTGVATGCAATLAPRLISTSDTRLGWTIGAGIEAMIARNWLLRAEYRYADYGTQSYTVTRSTALDSFVSTYEVGVKTHTALFGIAYKFDWGGGALARN